jgi:hypothetical protein
MGKMEARWHAALMADNQKLAGQVQQYLKVIRSAGLELVDGVWTRTGPDLYRSTED